MIMSPSLLLKYIIATAVSMCWHMDFSRRIKLMCTSVYEQLQIFGIALVHHN